MNKMQLKPQRRTSTWLRMFSLIMLCMTSIGAFAQTITTTFANNNGSSVVVFSISNNSATTPYILQDIGSVVGFTGTGSALLYAKPATYGVAPGAAGAITAANGWTNIGLNPSWATTANTTGSGAAATTAISGMSYVINPLTQVRFCFQHVSSPGAIAFATTGGSLRYSTVGVQTCSFVGGDLTLNSCSGYAYGGTMASPINQPRGFIGFVTLVPALPCSGTPTPGNTIASATSACPGVAVNFSLQNITGTGATYQWYNNAGAIVGATNSSYSQAITTADDFYCDVTCSGSTGTSNPVSVAPASFLNCYCAATAQFTADEEIYNVTIGGASTPAAYANANGCSTVAPGPGSVLSLYSNFKTLGPTFSVMQGGITTFEIRQNECDGATFWANGIGMWIDYNQNGVFTDPGEAVYIQGTTSAATGASPGGDKVISGTFTVPATAVLGPTVVRVICSEGVPSPGPCVNPSYGEVEDYLIDITVNTLCSGTPNPGNTIASSTAVCPSTTASFSLQNITTGTGVTYQWYSNSGGAIAGATNAFYSQVITAPDDFWCDVTCSGSGLTGTSTPVSITVNPFYNCYCTSAATSPADEDISNVTIGGLNNTSACGAVAPGPGSAASLYSNFTTLPPATLIQGNLEPYSVSIIQCNSGPYSNQFKIYIDYNQNGLFTDAGEEVAAQSGAGAWTGTGTISIPFTALPGITRMRVVDVEGTVPGPCGTYTWGETEDYFVNIVVPVGCTGTPNPGNTLASATSACPNTVVNLSLQNIATLGSGNVYQWYSNALGAIPGATNPTYAATITIADDFWCDVTCTNSSLSAISNPVSIAVNGFISCYCATGLGGSCGINSISSVLIAGTALNNVTNGCTSPYSQFPATGSTTATFVPGSSYLTTIGTIVGSNTQAAIWIDYNQNGVFETTEYTLINSNIPSGGSASGNLVIPITALSGQTGMRVRTDWVGAAAWTPSDACTNRTWGETEDYIVDIAVLNSCTGVPSPGNTLASFASVCPGGTVTLTLQNTATLGSGVTFQWYSNTGGAIAGATGSFYTATINATDDYWCDVTCTNSSQSALSNPVTVSLSPFFGCYCASSATQTADEEIYSVTVNGSSTPAAYAGVAGCTTPAPGPGSVLSRYSNFTTLGTFATLTEGAPVSFNIEENECDGATFWSFGTAIYIDYNHNGSYADAGELVFVETITATGPRNVVGTFNVPYGVTTGQTGMRVIVAEGVSGTGFNPCLSYGYGETEDFIVDILPTVACTGTPVPGNTIASASSVCPNGTVVLSLQNQASLGAGNTYQWYNSTGAISGATNATYSAVMTAATSFYCDVTCTASGLTGSSTPVSVGLNNFFSCYCTANLHAVSTPCIDEISINTLVNNTAAAGCALPAYTAFPAATATTSMMQGQSYTMTRIASGAGAWTGVWIDYDHSGTFDVPEYTELSTNTIGAISNSVVITIPMTALAGQTGMRIRQRTVNMTAADACTPNFGSGETEDYVVDIQVATPCSGTPTPGNTLASATAVCSGTTVNFSLQNATTGSGVTYQWFNNSGAISGATNSTYSQVMTAADAFFCEVTCSGQTGASSTVSITINAPLSCYCAAGATTIGCTTGDEYVGNVTLNTINNTSTCPPSGQYSDFTTISTNLLQGSTYTASVLIPNWFGGDQASVWIDFNHDGVLDDLTEQFPLTIGGGNGTTPLEGPVTIPVTALTGPTRMRVRGNYTGVMSSCGITTYGEVEDYTVVIDPVVTSTTLNLTAYIQAYWDGNTAMNPALFNQMQSNPNTDCDSITVELRPGSSPLTTAYSTVAVLQTNGTAACVFPSGVATGFYYIAVKGRNIIETWSADSVSFSGATAAYNFSTAAAQAYGANQIELTTAAIPNGIFAFYSGDIVKDAGEATDLLDLTQLEFEINNFSFGYYAEDLNGDGNVDILDTPSLEGNISGFIYSQHP